jgi:Domain of unknown function (DUF4337)
MSHGVHEVQHQAEHEIEHGGHGGHDENRSFNKKVALLISVLALFLSLSETMGKSSQTSALNEQIEASNLWNFFQAKNIRRTSVIIASQQGKLDLATATADPQKAALQKQIDEWSKTAERYRTEPETREGTTELMERAREQEHKRDHALAQYHQFEFASAAFQIGIVLASAAVITAMAALAYLGIGLGLIGLGFMALGLWAPHAVHLM